MSCKTQKCKKHKKSPQRPCQMSQAETSSIVSVVQFEMCHLLTILKLDTVPMMKIPVPVPAIVSHQNRSHGKRTQSSTCKIAQKLNAQQVMLNFHLTTTQRLKSSQIKLSSKDNSTLDHRVFVSNFCLTMTQRSSNAHLRALHA
jgi:hypothetical protein